MKKSMYSATVLLILLFGLFYTVFRFTQNEIFEILYITFMTFSYHFCMRLIVGFAIKKFHGNFDYNSKWFSSKGFEEKLYKLLKVKKWKSHIPTWSPESFEIKHNALTDIAKGMCQAEAVHETIAVLSFVPILFSLKYGVPAVFIITSLIAAATDMVFAIVQRYNRPRIVKLINKK